MRLARDSVSHVQGDHVSFKIDFVDFHLGILSICPFANAISAQITLASKRERERERG